MMRKSKLPRIIIAMILAVSTLTVSAFALLWTYSTSDQWGTITSGAYMLYNDVWGSGAGTQTLYVNSYSNWEVVAKHPATSGIKAYPNCSKTIGTNINSLGTCKSSFNVNVPTSNISFETAYDIWCGGTSHEIML